MSAGEWSPVAGLIDRLVRDVPDFPEPGIVFKDIAPLLADAAAFGQVVEALANSGRDDGGAAVVDKVVGIEARGFILAAPVALALGAGFVPVRKAGKLPGETYSQSYALEYGEATLETHRDAFEAGDIVLIVDDVLATGGTMRATAGLIEKCGAEVRAAAVMIELGALDARATVGDLRVDALVTV
jgi:adenine phosphoribosyltransferase